jgi:hypothetical protein
MATYRRGVQGTRFALPIGTEGAPAACQQNQHFPQA